MRQKRGYSRRLLAALAAVVVVLGSLLALPQGAKATLIGDTITITSTANFPVDTWTDSVLVGAGHELDGTLTPSAEHVTPTMGQSSPALFAGDFIDVDANSITINYAALAGFPASGYAFIIDFTGLDWQGIAGTLDDVTLAGGDMGILAGPFFVNITANSFQLQATVDILGGANFTMNLITTHDEVPEPSTLALFGIGLAGLGFMRRRRRKVWTGVGFRSA